MTTPFYSRYTLIIIMVNGYQMTIDLPQGFGGKPCPGRMMAVGTRLAGINLVGIV
jgi:hypothetical protein